jgi:hypothetical protein
MIASINFYKKIIQKLIKEDYALNPFELLIKFLKSIKDSDESLGFFNSKLSDESKKLIQHMSTALFNPTEVIPVLEQYFNDSSKMKSNCMIAPLVAYFYYYEASYPRSRIQGAQHAVFIYTREGTHYKATHLSQKVLLTLRRYICELEYIYEAQAKDSRNWKTLSRMIVHEKTKYELAPHLLNIFSNELEVRKLGMGLYMKEPDHAWHLLDINYDDQTKILIIKKILEMLSSPVLDEDARYMAYKSLQRINIPLEMHNEVSKALIFEFSRGSGGYDIDITLPAPLSSDMLEWALKQFPNRDRQTLLQVLTLCYKCLSRPQNVVDTFLALLNNNTDLLTFVDITLVFYPEIAHTHHKKFSLPDRILALMKEIRVDIARAGDLFIRVMQPNSLTQEQCNQLEQLLNIKVSENDRFAILSILCMALKKDMLPSTFKETLLKHIQKFCFEDFPSSFRPLLYTTLDSLLSQEERSSLFSGLLSLGDSIYLARVTCYLPPPAAMIDKVYETLIAFLRSSPTKDSYIIFDAFLNIKVPELYFLDFISVVKDKLATRQNLSLVAAVIKFLEQLSWTNIPAQAAMPLLEICQGMLENKDLSSTKKHQTCSLIQKIMKNNTAEVDVQCFIIFMNLLSFGNENPGYQIDVINMIHTIWPTDNNVQHDAAHAYCSFLNQHINYFHHDDVIKILISLNLIFLKIDNPAVRSMILIHLDSLEYKSNDNFKSSALHQGIEQLRSTHEAKGIIDEGIVFEDLKKLVFEPCARQCP